MHDDGKHQMTGQINPHCARCGKTAMQIAKAPLQPCRLMTLPFDEKPAPAKAALSPATKKERAS